MTRALPTLAMGMLMGFILSRIGFSSWDEVHAMFVLRDPRLLLGFALAVAVLLVGQRVLIVLLPSYRGALRTRPIHRGTLIGGIVFGAGWALSGACPSIALVQLGEGQLGGLFTLLGILAGNWAYGALHARFFRWDTTSCSDG